MKLDKATNLYERCEVICNAIRGKRNLSQQDTATIGLLTILNEVADSGKSIDELLGDEGKEWRIKTRDTIKPLFTAAKNFQNSYLTETEVSVNGVSGYMMPKATGTETAEEFC